MQRKSDKRGIERAIVALADRQHSMVSVMQLRALGVGEGAVRHREALGRWRREHRGVYFVGAGRVPKLGRWMAAVLAGGPGAALSFRSAGQLWAVREGFARPVDVTDERRHRPQPGIRFHCSLLPPDEVTVHEGIPVTTVPRTLLDLAAVLRPRELERALNEADVLQLHDRLSLLDLLARYPRRAGTRRLRAALDARNEGATVTGSELEERFLRFLDEQRLPRPEINAALSIDGRQFEPDGLYRAAGLVVELDGRRFHATAAAFEADRERDRRLAVAGWRTIRVTARMLTRERERVAADLRALLGAATLAA